MISIKAEKRKELGKKVNKLREQGILPAVLYGPEIDNLNVQLDLKKFTKNYKELGHNTLLSLKVSDKEFLVLVHEVKTDPLSGEINHVDFYQPILTKEVEATVPIIFEGEAAAVKELGGTLMREIQEVAVKALPQNLPHEIRVNIDKLKTFEDEILIKDLEVNENVTIQKEPDQIVVFVTPAENVEEELAEPVGEDVPKEEKEEESKEESSEEEISKEEKNE